MAAVVAGCVTAGLLVAMPGTPAQAKPEGLRAQVEALDDHGGEVRGRPWPRQRQDADPAPAPVWPKAGRARVALPSAEQRRAVGDTAIPAAGLPVRIARGSSGGRAPTSVDVEVLDRATAPALLRDGVLVRLSSGDARAGAAAVSVDYTGFRYAYGGDWASRLTLWSVPACALTARDTADCRATPLPSRNDAAAGTVTAQARLAPAGEAPTVLALAAGASGDSGDFTATSLAPSATWSSGGSTGDFTWNYPMRVPPAIGGGQPGLSLAYSSSSVDGRSSATNNQPSWVGEGFEYSPGFIERRYVGCADDMAGSANNNTKTGDLCWRSDNATMSLNGSGSELVFQAGKGWHARSEDGSKIEKLSGAGNGDRDGEYWKVTSIDGTQYFFGRHSLPGQSATTNSTNTVRVYGNHPGEPCNVSAFSGSHCNKAWRWNLDYVVDPRGNTISYWYNQETNKYAANLTSADAVPYVRASTLARIDYGTWDRGSADRSTTPVAQVVFTPADRCLSSCSTHDAAHWPDVPWDQECTGSGCGTNYSPTFWSTKRLAKITTRVWDTTKATPAWQDVDSWTLTHTFPPPGDGSDHAGLWLDRIVHAGHVGGTVTMPPVTFDPVSLPNRVLTKTNTSNNWHRIGNIITETGAKIQVTYSLPECTSGSLPSAAHTNAKLCYPVIGPDPIATDGSDHTEWWHKYVVRQVSESDIQLAGGHQAPTKNTFYTYVGSPAWHYADDDGLTKPKYKTWNQFRGYATVKAREGDTAGAQTLTVTTYLRGMDGDRLAPSGGARTVTVPASVGGETVADADQFAGMVREQVVYNGSESKPVSKTVNVPWMSAATASRTINGDTVTARFVDTATTYEATALGVDGAGGWRTTRTSSAFSGTYGTVDWTRDDGDMAVTGDEKCTTYSYNRNTAKNIVGTVKRTTTTTLACGTAPTSADHVISDIRNTYDGATSPDTEPVYGSVTRIEQLKDWAPAGGTVWHTVTDAKYDAFGRQSETTDVRGNTTKTAYSPASGGPITSMTTTSPSPYNWITTTVLSPYWGEAVKVTDPNGRVKDVEHDPMGRVRKVWEVGWPKATHPNSPSAEYSYTYSANRSDYPYVTTRTLHAGGGYRTSYQIFDGMMRPRQTQTSAVGGGRVVTDTIYDEVGRAEYTYGAHAEPGDPSGALWWEPEWSLRAFTRTVYDNASRPVAEIFLAGDGETNLVEKWRTTTAYEGDLTKATPPAGGTPVTTRVDAQGRTVEVRQHTTAQGVAGAYQPTSYIYNPKGQLVKVTDPAGNQWTYTFDVKGRQIESVDPDKGRTTSVYNDFDELIRTTDARGEVLVYTYDQLGRKTGLYDDSVSASNKRAEWKYDRLYSMVTVRGQLTEAIRYENGLAYKWQVRNFNTRYQPGGINIVIPFEETGLGGTYAFGYSYAATDGTLAGVSYPGGGVLGGEAVTTRFDPVTGLPIKLETNDWAGKYVAAQDYTPYGEPTLTTRIIDGGVYTQDATYYDSTTRRVTRSTVKPESSAGTVSDRAYSYDPAGNITSIAETPQVGPADTQCFRYDALRRLTSAWTPKAGVSCATNPAVANLGGPAAYWLDWTFDAVGNRLTQTSHAPAGDTKQTYTLPAGGAGVPRPHAVNAVKTEAPGQTPVTRLYGYDDTGNTTTRPGAASANQALTWDAEGRLTKVVEGGTQTSHVYDADGNRLLRRDATGMTVYLPGMEIRRENGVNTATRYYSFAGRTVASRTDGMELVWLYDDHQGTQQLSVHALNQQATIRRQTPYGEPRGAQPVWPTQKGFVGGDNDPTGLTHIGAREYDPGLGRFVSVDPLMDLADPQQWSGYAYANNNPVTFSDPTGMLVFGDNAGKLTAAPKYGGGYHEPVDSRSVDERRRDQGKKGIRETYCPTCREPGASAKDDDPLLTPIEWASAYWGTHLTNLTLQDRMLALRSWFCYYNADVCAAEAKADWEAKKQFFLELVGVADAQKCLGGDLVSCGWTAASIIPVGKIKALKAGDNLLDAGRSNKLPCSCLCARSFSGETRVLLGDGTTKPIKEVKVGDKVMAADPETGESGPREVTHVWVHADTVVDLEVDGHVITTTEDHPFWNATDKRWQRVDELDRGDRLGVAAREPASHVGDLRLVTARSTTAYNLTVADIHTYYVLAGGKPILVHNAETDDGWNPAWGEKPDWDPGNADDDGSKTPRGNQAQNQSFDDAIKEAERKIGRTLNPAERRAIHDEITKRGYGYHGIVDEAVNQFGKSC